MTSWIAERSSGRRTTSLCPAPANDEAYFGMSQKFEQLKFVFGTHESLARHRQTFPPACASEGERCESEDGSNDGWRGV
jgi:hypothetical protein